jgi:hypothetical protein
MSTRLEAEPFIRRPVWKDYQMGLREVQTEELVRLCEGIAIDSVWSMGGFVSLNLTKRI